MAGSVVDVFRVDFWFSVNILVDFICYCMGLVLGLIKSLFCPDLSSVPLFCWSP